MIVPGSILPGLNHFFGWYVHVRETRGAKKECTYWWNCSDDDTPEKVAASVARKMPYVEVLKIEVCTKPNQRTLRPIPPSHFQCHPELFNPSEPDDKPIQPLWKPGQPLPKFTPIRPRKPLWQQHH